MKAPKITSRWKHTTRKMRAAGATRAAQVAFPNGLTKHLWEVDGKWRDHAGTEYKVT